ncbi:MAG: nitroreductase family protein [Propionibacteriaceae bacterium]|nr:nitroreductase family protein [Propionibacteriaceae bacterium]
MSDHPNPATPATIAELLTRTSVRMFTPAPVPDGVKASILDCAFAAPTAGAQQLYTIIDVADPAIKATLAQTCDHQPFIASAPWVLLFLADCRRWLDMYELAGAPARQPGTGDLLLAVVDATIAAQNAVVAAHAYGLGSCYIGDIVEQREQVVELLGLDPYVFPAALLVLGYPTEQQLRRTKPARFPREAVVLTDRYRRLRPDELRSAIQARGEDFDRTIPAFCKRKYMSDFAAEMNRCVRDYLRPFLD